MKLKFEQFQAVLENPTVTADVDSIAIQPTKNTISVNITLETDNAKLYGVNLTDIQVENLNYEGYENLMDRVNERLKDFEVK